VTRSCALASRLVLAACSSLASAAALLADERIPASVENTQRPEDALLSPEEALGRLKLPEGFSATLFAGEPDVAQPASIAFDARGRLWVAEYFSYPKWAPEGIDRILIFEDADGDGRHDRRKVFWARGNYLSAVQVGFGGVWAASAPRLLFIPDRDGDDVPDGDPVVKLDGWGTQGVHNVFNGLEWGPDGWLYGLNGILAESLVGRPGAPPEERQRLNTGVWRYHPTREVFEVLAHGTTNPWGLDWDARGEAFFTNCVIGHLWHLVPGAHYARMFGEDYDPHLYGLIDSASDHIHWGGGPWQSSRSGAIHDAPGGGHAHCGAMVYLGDNWPPEYRGGVFTLNVHGRRLNHDVLERRGVGFAGRHRPDVLFSADPWFRGVAVEYGPDGGVYIADWSDLGECHDSDGVHRRSGRIFKVVHGKPKAPPALDLAALDDLALVDLHRRDNEWFPRQARRLLQERAAAGRDLASAHAALRSIFESDADEVRKLRALWTLFAAGGAGEGFLREQLSYPSSAVRAWALRFLADDPRREGFSGDAFAMRLAELARSEPDGLVRLHIASTLQRLPPSSRPPALRALAARGEDATDALQARMLWYAIEDVAALNPVGALKIAAESPMPLLWRLTARRAAEPDVAAGERAALVLGEAIAIAATRDEVEFRRQVLEGLRDGLRGRRGVPMPAAWKRSRERLASVKDAALAELFWELASAFGDPEALERLRRTLLDRAAEAPRRRRALETLLEKGAIDGPGMLFGLLDDNALRRGFDDNALRRDAIAGLARFESPETPPRLLALYPKLGEPERQAAIAALSARASFARALLSAAARGEVAARDISAYHARQIEALGDAEASALLDKVWGRLRRPGEARGAEIARWKADLNPDRLARANIGRGRELFKRLCGTCHLLNGEGRAVGPDLTGSNRGDLHYVLENVLDPSASVAEAYRMRLAITRSGQTISGVIAEETAGAVTLLTATDRVVLPRAEILELKASEQSLMPEGALDPLHRDEVRDLVAFLAEGR
jgi:putative membrane-bound dehydrogenase-like protein